MAADWAPVAVCPPTPSPWTSGIPSPFSGLRSLDFNWKECCFLGQAVFSFLLFSLLTFLHLASFLKVSSTDFLIIPLLAQHIQIEKITQILWKSTATEGKRKSSKISQGIKKYLSAVFREYEHNVHRIPLPTRYEDIFTLIKGRGSYTNEVSFPNSSNFIQIKAHRAERSEQVKHSQSLKTGN